MNVAPGSYTLSVDSSQLRFLQAVQQGGPLFVTVHRSRQGDIIDTLEIVLTKSPFQHEAPTGKEHRKLASTLKDSAMINGLRTKTRQSGAGGEGEGGGDAYAEDEPSEKKEFFRYCRRIRICEERI